MADILARSQTRRTLLWSHKVSFKLKLFSSARQWWQPSNSLHKAFNVNLHSSSKSSTRKLRGNRESKHISISISSSQDLITLGEEKPPRWGMLQSWVYWLGFRQVYDIELLAVWKRLEKAERDQKTPWEEFMRSFLSFQPPKSKDRKNLFLAGNTLFLKVCGSPN